MEEDTNRFSLFAKLKNFIIGQARNIHDPQIFHTLSLSAFFAWIGLGADGVTSSAYGPPEAFIILGKHQALIIFVTLATLATIFILSISYIQIIEAFPSGGGGYLVASKLLSPFWGMVSGSALILDYILAITISITTGVDSLLSFLPSTWYQYKMPIAILSIILFILINLRGIKESVTPLIPIFLTFLFTHIVLIVYAFYIRAHNLPEIMQTTVVSLRTSQQELGLVGMLWLVVRSFSMGAGTYTGLEAVSNGLPILREPKKETGKQTMRYMAFSLAFLATGIMLGYFLYGVQPEFGKTLNAVLYEKITTGWPSSIQLAFIFLTLFSEAALLFVAAQTGFLGGPRVLANMALDNWFPKRFALLSDRLVTQNGILLMGGSALTFLLLTGGSVHLIIVLFSINVFITFLLSEIGMVRYYWKLRSRVVKWQLKIAINIIGMCTSGLILTIMLLVKFHDGGWITLILTSIVMSIALIVKHHYNTTGRLIKKLDFLTIQAENSPTAIIPTNKSLQKTFDHKAKTAVVLVKGWSGLGLRSIQTIHELFNGIFTNFVFVEIGTLDAGTFKNENELDHLQYDIQTAMHKYVTLMKKQGYYAESICSISNDVVEEMINLAPAIIKRFPNAVFFGGRVVFQEYSFLTRLLHNYTVFTVQGKFYRRGIPFIVIPIRMN